ncbi:polymer-forming cytoskeletal protein [Candidatus Villigracilis affinis]|uniref:polymer-forming cytoskeletal protein n=1 Tax=Candidatus Villigracilis affinis TaxID=3140682 RepID=UPI002A1E59F4|nr:hypothetical protein [Anaerolineales bacterium]
MKKSKYKILTMLLLAALISIAVSGCAQIASESNYTLGEGQTTSGTLFILSQNADLLEGSSVDGSVIMLCCNLIVSGEVKGDVFLLTGNLRVDNSADVNGDISVLTGNVSK